MQKQAYDLKLCNYKQRRADTLYDNAKDTIGTYKQKMFSMKSRINELTDELTSTTWGVDVTKLIGDIIHVCH